MFFVGVVAEGVERLGGDVELLEEGEQGLAGGCGGGGGGSCRFVGRWGGRSRR